MLATLEIGHDVVQTMHNSKMIVMAVNSTRYLVTEYPTIAILFIHYFTVFCAFDWMNECVFSQSLFLLCIILLNGYRMYNILLAILS